MRSPPQTRSLGWPLVAAACLVAVGCKSGDPYRLPSPKSGLIKAREATQSGTPAQRAAAHRKVIALCVDEGWSDEAALDYLALRELSGKDDEQLLESVAWSALRSGLRAPDPARRQRAAQALARLIPNERAQGLLEAGLDDPHPEVQVACVEALGRAGWATLVETLDTCEAHSAASARRAALLAATREVRAGLVEPAELGKALPAARAALERGPDRVRLAALELIAALDQPEGAAVLAQGIAQADEAVSQRAAVLLAARDPGRAQASWRATHLSSTPELSAFERALGLHGDGEVGPVEHDLEGSARIQRAAIRGLWGPGAAKVAASLHELTRSSSRSTRLAALAVSRRWAPLEASALRSLWTHSDPATRVAAFTAAAERETLGLDALQPLWESGDRALAPAVAAHLATEGQRGLELLAEGVERPATSHAALRALRDRPEARPRFQALLDTDDSETRRLAAAGLVYTSAREDVLPLLEGLTTLRADTDVLCAAALLNAIQSPATPSVE